MAVAQTFQTIEKQKSGLKKDSNMIAISEHLACERLLTRADNDKEFSTSTFNIEKGIIDLCSMEGQ